jgi:hypothetical protein
MPNKKKPGRRQPGDCQIYFRQTYFSHRVVSQSISVFHSSTCSTSIHITLCLELPISTGLSFLLDPALLFTDYSTLFVMSSPTPKNSPNTPRQYAIIRRTVVIVDGKTHTGARGADDPPQCEEPGCRWCSLAKDYNKETKPMTGILKDLK